MASTLTSYFRDALKANGNNAKYFNRAFLLEYIRASKAAAKQPWIDVDGIMTKACWLPIWDTKFYQDNSPGYCLFQELYLEYEEQSKKYAHLFK